MRGKYFSFPCNILVTPRFVCLRALQWLLYEVQISVGICSTTETDFSLIEQSSCDCIWINIRIGHVLSSFYHCYFCYCWQVCKRWGGYASSCFPLRVLSPI